MFIEELADSEKSASTHFLFRAKLVLKCTTSSFYYVEYRMLLTIPVEEPVSSWLFKHTFGVEIHYCTIEMVNAAFWVLWIGSHRMLSIKLPSENISLAHMPLITYFCFLHRGRNRRWENWDSNLDLWMINSHSCCVSKPYLHPSTVFCDTQRSKEDVVSPVLWKPSVKWMSNERALVTLMLYELSRLCCLSLISTAC